MKGKLIRKSVSEPDIKAIEKQTELDDAWLSSHFEELSREHAGEHVAVVDQKAVAFGRDFGEAYKKAKMKSPGKSPLVAYIPKEGDELLLV
jgi:hypothetical protein